MRKQTRYIIIDGYAMGFLEWTREKPLTRTQIITLFHQFARDEGMEYKRSHFNFEMIADIWAVRLHPIDIPIIKCPECNCPTHKNICPLCDRTLKDIK